MSIFSSDPTDNDANEQLMQTTADIAIAYLSQNRVSVDDLERVLKVIHGTVSSLTSASSTATAPAETLTPIGASIRSSVKPDYIVCLEDGKKLKMLKRHLMTHYQMTPEQYRAKWGLKEDYPMTAPNYSASRRQLAIDSGLGNRRMKMSNIPKAKAKVG